MHKIWLESLYLQYKSVIITTLSGIAYIYELVNIKAEAFVERVQSHPNFGLMFAAVLLAVWLTGLLRRWQWACHWQSNSKLWVFDGCKPELRRRIQIVIVMMAMICCIFMLFIR